MRLFLVLALALAGVGTAAAEELEHDLLVLTSGERLVGELVDLRDGHYRMVLLDGRTVSVDFRTVARAEMAGASVRAIPMGELPLPEWSAGARDDDERSVAGGFDFGLTQGARVRFRMASPAVAHVDLKAGAGLLFVGGVGPALLTGVDVAFFNDSVVHLTLSGVGGAGTVWGGLYPFVGLGSGLQIDPRGPIEVHLGVTAGAAFGANFGVVPDLSLSWLW